MSTSQKYKTSPITLTGVLATEEGYIQGTEDPNRISFVSEAVLVGSSTFHNSNIYPLATQPNEKSAQQVPNEEEFPEFTHYTKERAIAMFYPSAKFQNQMVIVDGRTAQIPTHLAKMNNQQIQKESLASPFSKEEMDSLEVATETMSEESEAHLTPDVRYQIAKLLFEFQKEHFELLDEVNIVNTNGYLELDKGFHIKDSPIIIEIMYAACWTSLRVCRAIAHMNYRKAPGNMYYCAVDIPNSLLPILQAEFPKYRAEHPEELHFWNHLRTTNETCEANLHKWKALAARNNSESPQKSHLCAWVPDSDFAPVYISQNRLANMQKQSLFTLLELHEKHSQQLPPHLERIVAKSIAHNFLLLMVEQVSPLSLSKDPTETHTMLLQFDWKQLKALQADSQLGALVQMAREELKQTTILTS